MRQIGSIENPEQATRFKKYLATEGIPCTVNPSESGQAIWVHEEDHLERAREELSKFKAEPDHVRFQPVRPRAAKASLAELQKVTPKARQKTVDLRDRWSTPTIDHCPVCFGLMGLMVVVAVLTGLDLDKHRDFLERMVFSTDGTLNEISSGQLWRLLTPILLHFTILHFLFNLLMLRDLGLMIEYRMGSLKFVGMVLVIAAASNSAQFAFYDGPFGGMSGVNYGLFGFIWIRNRLAPEDGYSIHPSSVTYMMGRYVLCMIGIIPHVANGAHTGGLVIGAAMGAWTPMWRALTGARG